LAVTAARNLLAAALGDEVAELLPLRTK